MRTCAHPAGKESRKPRGKFKKNRKEKFYEKHPHHPATTARDEARHAALTELAAYL